MSKCQENISSDYILLSPVGIHKQYVLDKFIKAVMEFDPPPKEIVLCIDWDAFDLWKLKENPDLTILINSDIGCYNSSLKRIASAREILRNYFLKRDFDLALWIDCDIICPPDLPRILIDKQKENNHLIVIHEYLGRTDNMWHGSGIMLTTSCACATSKFYATDPHHSGCHVSEDYSFLAVVRAISNYFGNTRGTGSVICIDTCKGILHYLNKDLNEEDVIQMTEMVKRRT